VTTSENGIETAHGIFNRNTVIKYYDEIVAELQQERLRAERLEQLERDGHIAVKITPSQKLSDYILGELKK